MFEMTIPLTHMFEMTIPLTHMFERAIRHTKMIGIKEVDLELIFTDN